MSFAFVRIDAEATLHPKLLAVGPEAAWLWVCGLAHANRHKTNGLIMKSLLPSLYPDGSWSAAKLQRLAARLVDVRVPGSESGLWHDDGGVYRIHDYEKQQEYALKANVEARREYERSRKRVQRGGGNVPDMSRVSPGHSTGTPDGTPAGVPPANSRSRSRTDPDPSLRSGTAREPDDVGAPDLDARVRALRGALVGAFAERWERDAKRGMWAGPRQHAAAFDDLAKYLARHGDAEERMVRVLDAFFGSADPFVRKARWSPALLARDPGRYLEETQRGRPGWKGPAKSYADIDAPLERLLEEEG